MTRTSDLLSYFGLLLLLVLAFLSVWEHLDRLPAGHVSIDYVLRTIPPWAPWDWEMARRCEIRLAKESRHRFGYLLPSRPPLPSDHISLTD